MADRVAEQNFRKAVNDYCTGQALQEYFDEVYKCWNAIGFNPEACAELEDEGINRTLDPFVNVLQQFLEEQRQKLKECHNTVIKCQEEVNRISEELAEAPFQVNKNLPLIEQALELTEKSDILKKKRHDRMVSLQEYITTNRTLCRVLHDKTSGVCPLCREGPFHELNQEKVPSADQMRQLNEENNRMKNEKVSRLRKFNELKINLKNLLDDLERPPTTTLEKLILLEAENNYCLSDKSLKEILDHNSHLSHEKEILRDEIMNLREQCMVIRTRLKLDASDGLSLDNFQIRPSSREQLKAELTRLQILKKQNIQKFIQELRAELHELHVKCFCGQQDRDRIKLADDNEKDDDRKLILYEDECARLRDFYSVHSSFFQKIVKREELWKKKMETDEKELDPNRFNNRGGQLLRDQQEKRAVESQLQKIDSDLAKMIEQWEQENNTPFKVYDHVYADFLKEQREAYLQRLEMQKEERKKLKDGNSSSGNVMKRKNEQDSAKTQKNNGFVPRSPVPKRLHTHD